MNDIEFIEGELPCRRGVGGYGRWLLVIEKLKAEPGVWAIVDRRDDAKRNALSVTKSRLQGRGCEVATRRIDGELRLYARWPSGDTP